MSNFGEIQQLFLNQLKDKMPAHLALVDELSEILDISNDSAYRRIRGETSLNITEVYKLANHYGISLDSMMDFVGNAVTFENVTFVNHEFNSIQYLNRILADLKKIQKFESPEIVYAAKDIPIFQLFIVPEIAVFKTFFWTKTIASLPALEQVKFSLKNLDEEVMKLSDEILRTYIEIPSVEIWSDQTITSILKQIEYYFDSGLFEDDSDALILCDKLDLLLDHVKTQAGIGEKILLDGNASGKTDSYKLYLNEVVLPDNTILVKLDDQVTTYLSHDIMNYLITNNTEFSTSTLQAINNVIKRSSLISKVSEKERNKFFQRLKRNVQALKTRIEG